MTVLIDLVLLGLLIVLEVTFYVQVRSNNILVVESFNSFSCSGW